VLPQLDINNTIDHRPEGDEKWFLENEKTVTQFCRKLAAERPLKDIRDEYNYPKKKGIKDECSRLLEASTMKSRRGFDIQRLMNAMRQAHADASLQRTFKKSFTSFSHSTRNKTRDGLIRVRNIRALNGRFNTSITHAYSIVIGSKHITLNA